MSALGRDAAAPAHDGSAGLLVVGPVRAEVVGGVQRVVADVGGAPAWIESSDTPLRATPEAFGSAFLLPALHHGRTLALEDVVDGVWLENAVPLQRVFRGWWRYRLRPPRAARGTAHVGIEPRRQRGATVLFFSGGADSFYSLLRGGVTPDALVTVQGLDIPHDDHAHMAPVIALSRAVAAERGLQSIIVRTNLRAHPWIASVPWERSHGGVMAAVGHSLDHDVSDVLVSSSIALDRKRAWGSHWQTDPLHSSAGRRFHQVGMELRRVEKLRRIAAEPLVRRHLRVCWQNCSASLNCQRCQKCILTRLVLADCGVLDTYATLDGTATLARDIDALGRYGSFLRALAELAVSPRLQPGIRDAAARLLRRSRHAQLPWVRARRALRRHVMGWIGGST